MKALVALVCVFLFCITAARSQVSPRNLDFESKSSGNTNLFPWQQPHYARGKYLFERDSLVKHGGAYSLRISFDTSGRQTGDGTFFQNIGLDLPCRQLKISAWVLQEEPADTAGFVSLVVNQDGREQKVAVRGRSIVGATVWTQLSWEIPLDSFRFPLHHLRLNVGAKSKSRFWVDDIQILADGKDLFQQASFASATDETLPVLSQQQQANLQVLCCVWGFLKYFHPHVAAGRFSWDMELFKMISVAEKTSSANAFSDSLSLWITSLGALPDCKDCSTGLPDSAFRNNIDTAWMHSSTVNGPLREQLQQLFSNRHRGNGHYARYRPVGNLEFTNEQDYGNWRNIGYPNSRFRLLFLFRYWNIIQYFFPYKYVMGRDWNAELKRFIPLFAEVPDLRSYHLLMTELVNSVNDSHSGISDVLVQKDIAPLQLPVKTVMIDEKPVVTGYQDELAGKESRLQPGDIIEEVDGEPVAKIINRYYHFANGSNRNVKLAFMNAYHYLTGGRDSTVRLTIRREQQMLTLTVRRYAFFRPANMPKTKAWRLLSDSVALVNMGLLEVKDIPSLFEEVKTTRALIFDLRHYPRSTVYPLCKYLYERLTPFARTLEPDLSYPGSFAWKGAIFYGPKSKDSFPTYTGKVVVLVNENTQSQGEWTTMALQAIPGSVTIGSQTSGADGDVSYVVLPGNYTNKMTGLGVFYPDGTPTQRQGIKIDVEVRPTAGAIRQGRDELLEKALEEIKKHKRFR